ncbi:EAL domain-containing protein [Sphingomonas sp. So64.6b]|uniref:putative bifunctional diguanylate cyclase/phosphodiesterase n=1 Tax=Sphingomonas sp. So64.6b TaxID=2997354 RepID=UPI0018631FBE|nr:EAL domain-containing protein [Sphingomonas sp. So64.6b]QNA84853.1 EAL domain-containing protein [Sphingomonas sp. So64.6b]
MIGSLNPFPWARRSIASLWHDLSLGANEERPLDAHHAQFEQAATAWPAALLAQILATAMLAATAGSTGPTALLDAILLCGAATGLFAMAALALLKIRAVRCWLPHIQVRLSLIYAAGLGAGLFAMLWLTTRLPAGTLQLASFVAVFSAIIVTALALQALRAGMLAFAAALVTTIAVLTGFGLVTGIACVFLGCLTVATGSLARLDQAMAEERETHDNDGKLALRLIREFEDHGSGWFWQTDRHGRIVYLSPQVANEVGGTTTPAVGSLLTHVFKVDSMSPESERTLGFHLSSRTSFSGYSVRAAAGVAERWWSISGRPILDELNRFQGFIGNGSDLTEKRKSEAEITRLALFDSLTGLANRQRMRLALDQTLASHGGGYHSPALLLLDLDRFKAVNDTLGHQTGDALLKQVSQRLQRSVGEAGLVGRIGGDEFEVVLPREANRDRLAELARAIIAAVSQPYFIEGSSITIGCSIGIAIAPDDGEDSETLVRNADLALYAAKADGRGIHRFYREELLHGAQNRRQLEDDLRNALVQNEFHVAYQPVVSTRTERIVGYEALLRWDHPTRGAVSPAEFIPVAEDCGLIEAIGEWVLRTACADAATWPRNIRVAVNVSPIQFANPALTAVVTNALARSGISPARLELEITEGVFLNEDASSEQMFKNLKAIGVRLALDDFGTGYSSLGYLKKAPFDKIKIDQSFVRGAAVAGNRNAAIIKAIVTLADTLGMETTAEGVEVQDEIELIRELGCSHIQGYVYGKAARVAAVLEQLAANNGMATASGYRVSRSPRTRMLRNARVATEGVEGEVRIRNMSSTGAMIDGIEIDGKVDGIDLLIELIEGQMFPAKLRWAADGKAGIEFAQHFNMERLNPVTSQSAIRRSA